MPRRILFKNVDPNSSENAPLGGNYLLTNLSGQFGKVDENGGFTLIGSGGGSGATGATGATGPAGPTGATGPAGPAGGGGGSLSPITISWDGQGGFLPTGLTRYFVSPYDCTISGWSIVSTGATPSCTVDIWKVSYGTSLPTVSNTITGSSKPELTTGNVVRSTTLTGWTTSIQTGDIIGFNIDSATSSLTIKINLELS